MKKRLAIKIACRPLDKVAPKWREALLRGCDERLNEALRIVTAYGK